MSSQLILPLLILGIFIYSLTKKVDIYASFIRGVKDGLGLFIDIYPSLLAMSFAIALLKESGLLIFISDLLTHGLPMIPSEVIPMCLFRSFSGSTTLVILVDIFQTSGVDSFAGIMASIIEGSTDTTFYVISLYFSYVKIKDISNSLWIGLFADLIGIICAILLTYTFFS